MIQFAFIFTFIISLASAAFGILLSQQLRKEHPEHLILNAILFQQILVFVFSFYGIWGQILSQVVFSSEILSKELVDKISMYIALFATPFLIASWYFQLLVSFKVNKYQKIGTKTLIYLSLCFLIATLVLLVKRSFHSSEELFKYGSGIVSALVYAVTVFNFTTCKQFKSKLKYKAIIALILVGIIISAGTFIPQNSIWITLSYIVLFFILQLWLPLLFKSSIYFKEAPKIPNTFSAFCVKYEISKRESEIIQLICVGLTNKEIAEKLFITLQTVKDHTSRIYLKTEVKNRTQLANLAREYR